MPEFRSGAIGALLDEFDRSAAHYVALVESLTTDEFVRVLDTQTPDPDCRSAQSITRHVIRAGYGHTDYLRTALGLPSARPADVPLPRQGQVRAELERVCAYLAETFDGRWAMTDDDVARHRFETRWGVSYDLEQMLEHATVHVLRHRRQIARLLGRFAAYVG